MITGVQDIYYNVSDMKKSILFYTEALQMKLMYSADGWTSLRCGDVQIGLHPLEEGEKIYLLPRDSHGVCAQATLTLKSTDVSEDKKRIELHKGKILGEDDAPWGHMLVFEDPDGNVLKLMKPKY